MGSYENSMIWLTWLMVGSQMVGTVWKESRMWACGLGWAGLFWQGHVFQWVHHLLGSIFVKTHGIHPVELSTEECRLWSLASMIRINLIPVQGSIGDGLWIGGTGYLKCTCFIRRPMENFTYVQLTLKKILSSMEELWNKMNLSVFAYFLVCV